jgi:hypothetical protein
MLRARHSFSFNVILVCPTRLPFISFAYFLPFHASSFSIFHFFVLFPLSRPVFLQAAILLFSSPLFICVPPFSFHTCISAFVDFQIQSILPHFSVSFHPKPPSHLFSSPY